MAAKNLNILIEWAPVVLMFPKSRSVCGDKRSGMQDTGPRISLACRKGVTATVARKGQYPPPQLPRVIACSVSAWSVRNWKTPAWGNVLVENVSRSTNFSRRRSRTLWNLEILSTSMHRSTTCATLESRWCNFATDDPDIVLKATTKVVIFLEKSPSNWATLEYRSISVAFLI